MSLKDRILAARESKVPVGAHSFTIRRPSEALQLELFGAHGRANPLELVRRCVVGWSLTELDLFPGGSPVEAPFSDELWREYIDDHSELWEPLSDAILLAISEHNKKAERAVKK